MCDQKKNWKYEGLLIQMKYTSRTKIQILKLYTLFISM